MIPFAAIARYNSNDPLSILSLIFAIIVVSLFFGWLRKRFL